MQTAAGNLLCRIVEFYFFGGGFLHLLLHQRFPFPCRKANVVLEARQLAMKIFEDYTVSWYWIIM